MKKFLIVLSIVISTTFITSTSKAADIYCGLFDDLGLTAPNWILTFSGTNGTYGNYNFYLDGSAGGSQDYLGTIPDGQYYVQFFTNYNYPNNYPTDHIEFYYNSGYNDPGPWTFYDGLGGVYPGIVSINSNTYPNGWYFYAYEDPHY